MRDPLQLRRPPGPVRATLRAPGSKSISNRALLAAAMADGTSEILGCLDAEDSRLMLD
ncbi:MAG: 3-phosphoshikimate 1-carboxyvinyltransferase, partial [Myxococcales bacterium]|nr:3-phosphoshikimate 1-carboxyvinyltransferase [Myxococcales bacterium]